MQDAQPTAMLGEIPVVGRQFVSNVAASRHMNPHTLFSTPAVRDLTLRFPGAGEAAGVAQQASYLAPSAQVIGALGGVDGLWTMRSMKEDE